MEQTAVLILWADEDRGIKPGPYLHRLGPGQDISEALADATAQYKDEPNFIAAATVTWTTSEVYIEALRSEMEKQKGLVVSWMHEKTSKGELPRDFDAPAWDAYRTAEHAYNYWTSRNDLALRYGD